MAVTSSGSAEFVAVSSLLSYDVYKTYINPKANGKQVCGLSNIDRDLLQLIQYSPLRACPEPASLFGCCRLKRHRERTHPCELLVDLSLQQLTGSARGKTA